MVSYTSSRQSLHAFALASPLAAPSPTLCSGPSMTVGLLLARPESPRGSPLLCPPLRVPCSLLTVSCSLLPALGTGFSSVLGERRAVVNGCPFRVRLRYLQGPRRGRPVISVSSGCKPEPGNTALRARWERNSTVVLCGPLRSLRSIPSHLDPEGLFPEPLPRSDDAPRWVLPFSRHASSRKGRGRSTQRRRGRRGPQRQAWRLSLFLVTATAG